MTDMLLQVIINGFAIGTTYALIAIGYSLIYGASDLINFAQGDFLTVGAYLGVTLFIIWGMSFPLTLIIAIPALFVLGYLVEKVFVRPLIKKGYTDHLPTILMTLAIAILIRNASMLIWGAEPYPFKSFIKSDVVDFIGVKISPETIAIALISIGIMVAIALFLKYTKLGRAMIATAYSRETASLMGINVHMISGIAFGIAFFASGISGILIAPQYTVEFHMGIILGLKGFAAAILGGFGNLYGAILGGILVGIFEGISAGFISSVWKDGITFAIIIIFLLVRPNGILGKPGGGLF